MSPIPSSGRPSPSSTPTCELLIISGGHNSRLARFFGGRRTNVLYCTSSSILYFDFALFFCFVFLFFCCWVFVSRSDVEKSWLILGQGAETTPGFHVCFDEKTNQQCIYKYLQRAV